MIKLKTTMVLRVTPQHKCKTRKQQTSHITTALTTRATPTWQKHSTQLDIAVRERAYFLWGSSPCLEWRVYTHNASPARRGGSPGQSAPPLGSPGSTGPGPLWCRTGKRRSPCYLWERNVTGPVIQQTEFYWPHTPQTFSFMHPAIRQVRREKIKPWFHQTE